MVIVVVMVVVVAVSVAGVVMMRVVRVSAAFRLEALCLYLNQQAELHQHAVEHVIVQANSILH